MIAGDVAWMMRDQPNVSQGVLGLGSLAVGLAQKMLRAPEALARSRCLAGPDLFCVLASLDDLPWVDGAIFIAPVDSESPVWAPSFLRPTIERSLLLRLVQRMDRPLPVVLLPRHRLTFSLNEARTITVDELRSWLGGL